jgi:sigma-B regulation protein RsbU (phosphoserine phosphatase)
MRLPRIVVVDDDHSMLRAIERVLRQNYDVVATAAPRDALKLVDEFKPDLAILDIRMPELDGFELMKELKDLRPHLDIILMTGSVHEIDGQLVRAIREKAFYFLQKPFDREVLQTLVQRCLELRKLNWENRNHVMRLQREIAEARAFQQSMLPKEQGSIANATVCARYIPCFELGGDLYDYAAAPSAAAFLIADVSGHGASAAMLTGIVKSAFHSAGADEYRPMSVLERVHSGVRAFGSERFITMVCVRWSAREGTLEYVNAGHPPAIVWGTDSLPDSTALIHANGPPVSSAFSDVGLWTEETLRLSGQDRLLLFTDGIIEVENDAGFFGLERLMNQISLHRGGGPNLLNAILAAVHEFSGGRPLEDDCTLLSAHLAPLSPPQQ